MKRKFKELTHQEIMEAIEEQETLASILKSLDCHDNTSNRNKLKQFIIDNQIDVSHIKSPITREKYEENPKRCKYCGKIIPYERRENEFCNRSCSASYNNQGVCRNRNGNNGNPLPKHSYCLNCGKEITRGNKFCNNKCQQEYYYKQYIERWKNGEETGIKGKDDTSAHIRRYLFDKYNNSCQECGWDKVNPYTGLVPLQIHHIDGDCKNNKEENLQLLCPNCHSLTENFGARNKNCTRVDKRVR